ncbi:hypothetical protein U9M48_002056 [Paspalum notatum var. saurae]|uniref:Disease resistance protein winged helix domain-containing protein n=1 Tax=Paspalum notatum var. saurae TaxID=547442 RepID=A0AAQ3PQ14_PASNO
MIRTVLRKSYDGLPYHYLSIFPEDQIISQRHLCHRWAVEGYATETHGKSAIEIVTTISWNSRTEASFYHITNLKSIDSCKVHDLIRDIVISKSMQENVVFKLEEGYSLNTPLEEGYSLNTPVTICQLAISRNWEGDQSEFESIVDMSRLHYHCLRGMEAAESNETPYIGSSKHCFALFDINAVYLIYHKLVHVKYLSLRQCIYIELMSDSLGNLRQLQMLDYINAGNKRYFEPKQKDSLMKRCLRVSYLCATCCVPVVMDIRSPLLPRRDECTFACCVQFPAVNWMGLDFRSECWKDIGMLTRLCKLRVAGISEKNVGFTISKLRRLESLSIRSEAGEPVGLQGCLDGISLPPENLQSLELYSNLETLPKWI